MLVSDLIGGLGGVMLAVPRLRDQYYRFKRAEEARRGRDSAWPKLRQVMSQAWEERRND